MQQGQLCCHWLALLPENYLEQNPTSHSLSHLLPPEPQLLELHPFFGALVSVRSLCDPDTAMIRSRPSAKELK
jgi:hypothetical protein